MTAQESSYPKLPNGRIDIAKLFYTRSQLSEKKCVTPNCIISPWVSFFFDGTNNNRDRDLINANKPREKCAHSNIVSLFDISKNLVEKHYFSYYIQGVGTIFKEIGEPEADDKGLAMAKGGSKRISYALLQRCNAISNSFNGKDIFSLSDFQTGLLVEEISTEKSVENNFNTLPAGIKKTLKKLSTTIGDNKAKPTIDIVNVAVFGFSRGAAEVRSFARCRIPDDHLSKRIWKLALAREGMGMLLQSLRRQQQ
ncbi:phospholipase effector Tle1 domain-containing protein [Chromobacterium violaceum]|uniref:phospholipase effector Tle1 domain-containing protein n=1 Tax=Chromobacterium violaceum TaxID=536 RepID=UPI001B3215D1|nr:DUF2235 domain-containing protein [Chromobacterium violaceum]